MPNEPMNDFIVLIPGILGSVLVKNDREVWGASAQSVINNLRTFGGALKDLQLEPGIGHEHPRDGVLATRLLPRLHMIPTLWKVDGYGKLRDWLWQRFSLVRSTDDQAGNFMEFPYDWRLSNQLNAQLLAEQVWRHLDRWRLQSQNREAKLILICHSMGGLIARWFLEKLSGRDIARTLITIGTPYQGSINALEALANGASLGFGPIGISIDQLVRSFPSVYQLLPTYQCIEDGEMLKGLLHTEIPNVDRVNIKEAFAFHAHINGAVRTTNSYRTFVVKGIDQPTSSIRLR